MFGERAREQTSICEPALVVGAVPTVRRGALRAPAGALPATFYLFRIESVDNKIVWTRLQRPQTVTT